jgi:hypothetical protein
MEAPDFGNHIGRCVKVAVNLRGWTGAFVERKACKEDGDPSDIWGMHAVQFFDEFMNITRFEHAIKQRDSRKVYSDYFWLEEEEKAGRLVFTDSFAMGWSRPEKCPKVWKTRDLAGVVSPEGLAMSQGALPAPTPLLALPAPPQPSVSEEAGHVNDVVGSLSPSARIHDRNPDQPLPSGRSYQQLTRVRIHGIPTKRGRGRPTGPSKKTQMKERLAAARERAKASKAVEPAFSGYHTVSSLSKPKKTLRQIDVVETYEKFTMLVFQVSQEDSEEEEAAEPTISGSLTVSFQSKRKNP